MEEGDIYIRKSTVKAEFTGEYFNLLLNEFVRIDMMDSGNLIYLTDIYNEDLVNIKVNEFLKYYDFFCTHSDLLEYMSYRNLQDDFIKFRDMRNILEGLE